MASRFIDISIVGVGFLCLVFIAAGCSVNKYIGDDKKLYGGATVTLADESKFIQPTQLKRDLISTSRPKENSKIKLWYHFKFGNPNKDISKGTSNWIKRTIGEEPVYYNREDIQRSTLYLRKYLFDRGYFSSEVKFDTSVVKKEVIVNYQAQSEGRYRIRDVHWPVDSVGVTGLILANKAKSKIQPGAFYNVENLVAERERLSNLARNNGYYQFNDADIFYFVDTTAKTKELLQSDIWIKLKEAEDSLKFEQFYIGETHVYPNYDLSKASSISLSDTINYDGLIIYQNSTTSTPRVLRESISQPKGALYSVRKEEITLNHLLELGIYKYVNQNYKMGSRRDSTILDRYIYLTPAQLQDYRGEVDMSSRAGDFGLFLKGNYTHKNIFNGAERIDFSFGVGVQRGGNIQVEGETFSNNLTEINGSGELTIPRFLVPFIRIQSTSSTYTPKSKIGLFATLQNRRDLFKLLNLKLAYGYDWRETKEKRHEFYPFNLNFVQFSNITPDFEAAISTNARLQQSISDLLIPSFTYQYTYTNQELGLIKSYDYFRGKLEGAGKFASLEIDYRRNILKRRNQLVLRLAPAMAVPYSSKNTIPYIKQYFVGGANSLRAFPNRGLLGSYDNGDDGIATSSFDQIGDVKLEMNAEYRFDLWKFLYMKGAFFVDAGNVWLLSKGEGTAEDIEKSFELNKFVSEIGVGAGFGIRFDVQFLVLRLDFAIPIRKPFLDKGDRWTVTQTDFMQWKWLKNNGSFNLGIGYPF